MNSCHWDRREFLRAASACGLAGAAPVFGATEPPPETTRIRLGKTRSICLAPVYLAQDLLRAEGFTDVQYLDTTRPGDAVDSPIVQALAADADIGMNFAARLVVAIDMGAPVSILAGVHSGCFELFVTERIRTINDLKGKTAAVLRLNSSQHVFLASIAASVGIDPRRDINWVTHPPEEAKRLLAEGRIDAFLGFPPDPQELRARNIGRVVLNSATDRPWSQYFCCMVVVKREFAQRNPIATRRALRALIKATELCATDPDRGAKAFLDQGFPTSPEYAKQAIRELSYRRWRDFNPEDTVRFYALRLREAGMVKSTPQKLISQGTDWRLLEQLKREMKT